MIALIRVNTGEEIFLCNFEKCTDDDCPASREILEATNVQHRIIELITPIVTVSILVYDIGLGWFLLAHQNML